MQGTARLRADPPVLESVDLRPLSSQQLLVGRDELKVGGGGGIVVALQLGEEVLSQCAHRGVEQHAHALHRLPGCITWHLHVLHTIKHGCLSVSGVCIR